MTRIYSGQDLGCACESEIVENDLCQTPAFEDIQAEAAEVEFMKIQKPRKIKEQAEQDKVHEEHLSRRFLRDTFAFEF